MSRVDTLILLSGTLLGSILAFGAGVPPSLIIKVFVVAGVVGFVLAVIAIVLDKRQEVDR